MQRLRLLLGCCRHGARVPFSGVILTRPSDFPEVSDRSSVVSLSGRVEMSPCTRSKEASKQLNISTMNVGGMRSWREGVSSSGRPMGRWFSLRSKWTSCLGEPAFFTKASYAFPSSGLRASNSSERYSIFFAFGPTGPLGFFSSLAEALLEEAASAARGAADGFEPGRNPPRSVAAGSLLLPGLPAAAPAPFAPGKPGGFLLLLLLLLPRGVLLPARGVVEPFLEPPPPSGLLRGEAARGDLPLFALLVLPVRSVSETPDAEPSLVASSGVLRCVDAIGGLESAASAYSNLGPKQKAFGSTRPAQAALNTFLRTLHGETTVRGKQSS